MKWLLIGVFVLYIGVLVIVNIAKNAVMEACAHGDQSACHVLTSNR